jgi:hypothetical protein
MAEEGQEPQFEVVDEATNQRPPQFRASVKSGRKVVVLKGWRAKALFAALLLAGAGALVVFSAALAAAAVVGGALLGAGYLARKVLGGGSSSRKNLEQGSGSLTKR